MARTKSLTLTDLELRLMEVLWHKKAATVAEVVRSLEPSRPLAYNTVLTMMGILEQKGYLRHRQQGRAFIYEPAVNRRTAEKKEIKNVLRRFFHNSPKLLVLNLLEQENISLEELKRTKRMIEEKQ